MYYNIKIKSQKSEFILESNDKLVTQREMDIYFAYIFNASEEFVSKIKKVKIVNENLKSIEEIEKLANKSQNFENKITEDKPSSAKNLEIIKQIEPEIKTPEVIEPTTLQPELVAKTPETVEQVKPEIKQIEPEIKTPEVIEPTTLQPELVAKTPETVEQVKPEIKQIEPEIKTPEVIEPTEPENKNIIEANSTKSSIEEIIELAQNEIESLDLSINNDLKISNQNEDSNEEDNIIKFDIKEEVKAQPIKIENEKEIYHDNNQVKIDNIFLSDEKENTPTGQEITITALNNALEEDNPIQNNEIKIISQNQTPPEIKNNGIIQNNNENIIKEEIKNEQELVLNEVEIDFSDENQFNLNPEENINKEEETNQIQQTNLQTEYQGPTIDFSLFLSSFGVNELFDTFLICAYYIKNILREQSFSMKFINSKIFPATGKIADMSITEALIREKYINTINIDDIIKYTITEKGEEYFLSKFKNKT